MGAADPAQVAVDRSLQSYWRRQQLARKRARRALPEAWRGDPPPEMQDVADAYVEMLSRQGSTHVLRFTIDDR